MARLISLPVVTVCLVFGSLGVCTAAIDTYYGIDPGTGPGQARPNSDAAAAAFDAAAGALGAVHVIDCESLPVGNFVSKEIATGVTVTLVGYHPTLAHGVSDVDDVSAGYNTTLGGSKHLRFAPQDGDWGWVHIAFAEPIQGFGACMTGLGTSAGVWTVVFDDGDEQELSLTGAATGGVLFHGFTDAGKAISSIAIEVFDIFNFPTPIADAIGLDDIRYVTFGSSAPLEASLDIKPGTDVNSINLKSKGVLPVAVLTTDDLDACTVDPATVGFGPADAAPLRWVCEDVDGDGDADLLFHFRTQATGLTSSDTYASLIGCTLDGDPFIGTDAIQIVPTGR